MSSLMTKTVLESGLFSADSHVIEPVEIWKDVLPPDFFGSNRRTDKPGGKDPELRKEEMEADGVVAEVLYATLGLRVHGIQDPETQEAACRAYNDWLARYYAVAPDRLFGVALIAAYDADRAVEEIERCASLGFRGVMLWQVPHPDLPFRSHHYDPIWQACVRLSLPVSLHILSGYDYSINKVAERKLTSKTAGADANQDFRQVDRLQRTVNLKLYAAMDSTTELVVGGVFERFPDLKIIIVENECGWLPFAVTQWDYFCLKQNTSGRAEQKASGLTQLPSGYVGTNIYATFFRDVLSATVFRTWGADTFMWSNDFPHNNSTWPNSRDFIADQLQGLPEEILRKVLRTNAEDLYGPVPEF
jgi:predicted TIM-barrel fold metal-dependent hydrolase